MSTDNYADEIRHWRAQLSAWLDELAAGSTMEPHAVEIARAHFEVGCTELERAIEEGTTPERFILKTGSDKTAAYYAPSGGGHGSTFSSDIKAAIQFARRSDAERQAAALGIAFEVVPVGG